MAKKLLSKTLLLAALLLAGVSTAWADKVTFTAGTDTGNSSGQNEDQITKDGITLSGTSMHTTDAAGYRIYASSEMTISSTVGEITSIVITSTANKGSKYGPDCIELKEGQTGTYSTKANSKIGEWTGNANSVIFSAKSQCRATSIEVTYTPNGNVNVDAPTISPAGGQVVAGTKVTIASAQGTTIYYTTDGSNPSYENNNGVLYSDNDKITITGPCTIKAIAVDADGNESAIASETYTISVEKPTFSVEAGDVEEGTELTMSATTGHTIHYTTDGSNPTANSTAYTAPIAINSDMTVKAIAVDAYNNASAITSATYSIKIAGAIDITPNYSFFGETATFSGSTYDEIQGTQDGITITVTRNSGSLYANQNAMRFYKDNAMTVEAPESKVIKTIILTMSSEKTDIISDPTGYDNTIKKWTGEAATVTLSRPSDASGYAQITKITVVLADATAPAVAAPVISLEGGTYLGTQSVELSCTTEGATIYYTLDGTDPTANSTEYTEAIAISESCTLKAIAVKDNDASNIASAAYTITQPLTTIAQIKEQSDNSKVYVQLTGAQVVFASGNDIYVRDATGAMDFYKSEITDLATGDIFDATIEATYTLYKGLPELKDFTAKTITKKGNETVVAKEISADAIADHVCDLVKFAGVQITLDGNKYYIGETGIQLYDKFRVEYTTETGKDADITGVVIPFGTSEPYTMEVCPRMAEDIVYLDNAVAVAVGQAGFATFCSAQALDFTATDAIEAYVATVNGETINFTQVKKVAAEMGVLLRSVSGEAVEVNVPVLGPNDQTDAVTGNALVGTLEEIASLPSTDANNGTNYILNDGANGIGFYKANDQKVGAGKAYLHVAGGQARTFIGFDSETAISAVESAEAAENAIYNLSGQRVMQPTKGLYIVNGKKVVLK